MSKFPRFSYSLPADKRRFAEIYNATFDVKKAAAEVNITEKTGKAWLKTTPIQSYLQELSDRDRAALFVTKEALILDLYDIKSAAKEQDPRLAIIAIQELNRMMGNHAATKTETTIIAEQPLLPLPTDIDFTDVTDQSQLPEGTDEQ